MKIIVQKYGGTSLREKKSRIRAIEHIKRAREEDYHVVVVVSAMGRRGDPYATDTLLDLLRQNGDQLSDQERDLLLSCGEIISAATLSSMLNSGGIPAVALSGGQAGILTNDTFSQAQILSVRPQRILAELAQNKVVIVCGFQGVTSTGEITTLGRGGSDTTAAALGVALEAEYIDIFTDVEGVMTADPRVVKDAVPLSWVTYTEFCNLAYQGAKVIHPRAVEIAMQGRVPIRVRSTWSDGPGTLVTTPDKLSTQQKVLNERFITGITFVPCLTQLKVAAKENQFDLQLRVFKGLAENKISVDFISVNPGGIAFTVFNEVADKAISLIKQMGYQVKAIPDCAKVSTVGAGMAGVPGIMAQIIEALTAEEIPILQSADSHTTIWVLVKEKDMNRAVNALHRKFNLHNLDH